jgi:polyhydroxyalkanoate synthesis repressor PhaR
MSESKYVTLDDMSKLIREGYDVKVIDAKTKEDVTSFILTQIILEQAKNKNILLPVPFLHFVLRNGDNLLPQYLENNFKQFIRGFDIFTR